MGYNDDLSRAHDLMYRGFPWYYRVGNEMAISLITTMTWGYILRSTGYEYIGIYITIDNWFLFQGALIIIGFATGFAKVACKKWRRWKKWRRAL